MKRVLICLLAALLLAGCNLRNRQDSAAFIPPEGGSAVPASAVRETEEVKPPADWGQPVKELSADTGVYLYRGEETAYRFRLPFVDLLTPYAALCNQIIDADYGAAIRDAKRAMEERKPLTVRTVDYETWQHGALLTLRVYKTTEEGVAAQEFFCINVNTGDAASPEELRAAADIPEADWPQRLEQAVSGFYRDTFGPFYDSEDLRYSEGLRRSTEPELLAQAQPRYLTREGSLVASVTVVEPSGAANTVWLLVG